MHLTRRELILGATTLPLLADNKKPAARPGIVLIVVEDLGAWMLGCHGNKEIRTPAIDLLARSGARFNYSYSAAPTAMAGRAALLSGRAPRQLGFGAANATRGTLDGVPLLTDMLAGTGYTCAFAGAWSPAGQSRHGCASWDVSEDTGEVTAKAGAFLDTRKAGEPFLLVVSHTLRGAAPAKHLDSYASTPFNSLGWEPAAGNASANQEALRDVVASIRKAAAAVTAVDEQIGALVAKLDQKGLRGETLIVVTGSNGALLGRHGLWGDGRASTPPNLYEEVVNVPLIWQWHGHTPPQEVRPEFVSAYDLVPTVCELVNAPLPRDGKLPGRSYVPATTGKLFPKKEAWRSEVFAEGDGAVMVRDKRYKLVLRAEGGRHELFDVLNERREKVNQYENPRFVTIRDELAAGIATWQKNL